MQPDLNARMRGILVDWLIEVHFTFQLQESTLYLAVQLVDEYLSVRQGKREALQLIGITAFFIAAKYEELDPIDLLDCTYVTNDTYDEKDVLDAELEILGACEWRLTRPTPDFWLRKLAPVIAFKAHFYLQKFLLSAESLDYPPSMLASAATVAAIDDAGDDLDDVSLPYALADIDVCKRKMLAPDDQVASKKRLDAVFKKFHSSSDVSPVLGAAAQES